MIEGNVGNCPPGTAEFELKNDEGLSGFDGAVSGTVSPYTGQDPPGTTPFADDATMLNVTVLNPGVVIKAIFVKGGDDTNRYDAVVPNMISPFNKGGEVPAISHWNVCYDQLGVLGVAKAVAGPPPPAGAQFTIEADCTDDAFDQTFVFDAAGNQISGGSNPFGPIPLGVQCTVEETDDGGAASVTYDPCPPAVTIASEPGGQRVFGVTVTNLYTDSDGDGDGDGDGDSTDGVLIGGIFARDTGVAGVSDEACPAAAVQGVARVTG